MDHLKSLDSRTLLILVISEIVESCRAHDYTDVVLVHEHRGKPDGLIVCHLPYGPTAYFQLCNVVSRHDIKDKKAMGTVPQAYPHLIINNFTTKLGERTANILKHLFPVPKPDTKRIITFSNEQDYISFRHHIYDKPGGPKSIELKEIGPRFELILFLYGSCQTCTLWSDFYPRVGFWCLQLHE
ncbi:putative anticodon-binding, Brix domain-containing protein [Rosa chinensis]|uniref:Putative anticodon-binding, Brix domain-containing protein n=1 Tax=Rosa chinensis TaxID=74649 RepID=A0A2P6S8W8_ROSCH|nr:putative anticodon-binding, Brix domain-containing protein [Rosa chinensis]